MKEDADKSRIPQFLADGHCYLPCHTWGTLKDQG